MATTQRRKLLTAAIGVATVSYVIACGGKVADGGGLTSGNLVAAGGSYDGDDRNVAGSGGSSAGTAGYGGPVTSGNLVAPPYLPPPEPPSPPPPEFEDAGSADAAVPSGNDAPDAAPGGEDAGVDSEP